MKKLLLILLCLPMIGFGQTYVPDDNFEAYLEANGMGNGVPNDDYVTTANINSVTSLSVSLQGIADLTGIEDFTALAYLDCVDNQLTSLDVSTNTALTVFHCYSNQLTSLDVSANTALTHLYCYYNQLTSLDVSQNTALIVFHCFSNQLTSLDVSGATALTYLTCYYNQLTTLDVSFNTALTYLDFYGNQLTNINLNQNTALTELRCGVNLLTSLNVSQNTALIFLNCWDNQLTTLDVSYNTALTDLDFYGNQLTTLDVSQNVALTQLECSFNQLTSLDVRNGNNINFGNFNTTNNTNLYCIDVDDVAWADTNWTVANGNIDSTMSFSTNCATAFGCTDSLACNYDPLATIDDSSCCYSNTSVTWINSCDYYTTWNGIIYTSSAVYTDTIPATQPCMCDSIATVYLTIVSSTFSYDTLSATSSVVWNGSTLNISGNYSDTLINSAGCDSIAYLNLTITNTTGLLDVTNTDKILLKITDVLGKETPYRRNTPLFYIYDDGTVEKRIVIE